MNTKIIGASLVYLIIGTLIGVPLAQAAYEGKFRKIAVDQLDISAGGAINYLGTGTLSLPTGSVTSTHVLDGTLLNADVNASAAIAYSKLNLATSIVNADVSTSAAIAYSKLALTNSLVAGDLTAGAVTGPKLGTAANKRTVIIPVEDLGADGDIATRAIWQAPSAVTVTAAKVISQGTAAGIDNSNTAVIVLANATAANTIVTATYNTGTPFPSANTATSLGALANAAIASADILTIAVTDGSTANPPLMAIQVEYTVD